jgi:hypothetical protein
VDDSAEIPDLFAKFPKQRPALPKQIAAIYESHYKSNREGDSAASSVAQKLESWMHKKVASTASKNPDHATLELGAGTLNQLSYESNAGAYDIVEPQPHLYQDSSVLAQVRSIYRDIDEIGAENLYHRITSVAVLEHICNLPYVVAKSCSLLADEGAFCAGIPNEGEFLWGLAWRLSTGLEFKLKYGADYGALMRHEHVNTADEIEQVLGYFFGEVSSKKFGVTTPFSLYRYLECRAPNRLRCNEYISLVEGL